MDTADVVYEDEHRSRNWIPDAEGPWGTETTPRPPGSNGWLEEHSPGYQYGWVLLLLGATFVVMAAGPPDAWTRVLTVFLQGLTLLAALLASRVSRRLFRIAAIVALVALMTAVASVQSASSSRTNRRVLPAQHPARGHDAGRDRARAVAAQAHRHPNRARCGVHLRAARDDVRLRVRSHQRLGQRRRSSCRPRTRRRPTSSTSASSPRRPSATATSPPPAISGARCRCSRR